MEKKKVVPVWVSVILLTLCVVGTVVGAYWAVNLFEEFPLAATFHLILMLTNISAIAYCMGGYKKNSAIFFKLVCIFLALSSVVALVDAVTYHAHALIIIISALLLAIRIAFVFIKNLGKKPSYILAFAVLALMIFCFISEIIVAPYVWLSQLNRIVVDVVFFIMVYAKYQDKTARGTK